MHGFGLLFDCLGRLVYSGQFEKGRRNGFGMTFCHQNYHSLIEFQFEDLEKLKSFVECFEGEIIDNKI